MKVTFTDIRWENNGDGHLPYNVTMEVTDDIKSTIESLENDSTYDDCEDAYLDDMFSFLCITLENQYPNSRVIDFEYDIKGD